MGTRNAMTGNKPLDDLSYDLVTVLHEKAKGLEAIDQYMQDADEDDEARQILEKIRKQDEEQIEQIKRCVVRRLSGDASTRSGAV